MRMKRIFNLVLVSVLMLFVWSDPAISKLTIDAVEQTDGGTYVNPTITGGTIDDTPIGQTTPAAGSFTTLETDILKLDHNVEPLAADKTLVITDKVIQKLDPDGTDRNVLLPAENTATDLVFFVYNMGGEVGEDLNIQDDASGALAGVGYEQMGICTCDGTTWTVSVVCCSGSCILNFRGKEENTSNIVTGQPVYISGATGAAFPNYGLADCDDSSKIRVKGLAAEDVTQNTTGYVRVKGLLEGVDSTKGDVVNPNSEDWTAGDQLWVSTTVGGLTNVRPLGRSIKIGTALTVEGANSKILVDVRENSIYTGAAAGEDIIRQMGDNAGANKISYRDSDGNEVGSLNSDGAYEIKDANDMSIIKHVLEPGLGGGATPAGRLTIGLDETARSMVICDAEDVDIDFGLSVGAKPTLNIFDASASYRASLNYESLYYIADFKISGNGKLIFQTWQDLATGNNFSFLSGVGAELTDTNAEQSWLYVEPKINQSATAAYNGLKIKVTETALGDASTGDGGGTNNLILAGTSTDPDMFKVDNVGRICVAESSDPTALADHVFFYGKDAAGTAEAYAADAAANAAQLTPHNFDLFEPDPLEAYPWSYYAENKALGIKINVDMAGAIRAIEGLTGKTFIYTQNIAKEVNLEKVYKDKWIADYITANTQEAEITKIQALETVQEDVTKWYLVETPYQVCDENGTCVDKIKIVKQQKKIGETVTGYELVDGEVRPKIEILYETEKADKLRIKAGMNFNEADGKFYMITKPSKAQAITAAATGFKFGPPKWLGDRLKK